MLKKKKNIKKKIFKINTNKKIKKKKIINKKNKNYILKKKNKNITHTPQKNYYQDNINILINKYKFYKKKILYKQKINKIFQKRPPILTIMGHVNHGKTSLIDCIRSSNIIDKEIGNITQYIHGYNIKTKLGRLTLLDTPGHSTFKNMRKRGIKITDLIILVIAIDDGIMPQTIEILEYANKYNVPILIILNKIDKKNYLNNIKKIKQQLYKFNILDTKLGGKNIFIKISTKFKKGINKLIKNIFIESKKLNLKTRINGMSNGIIIESGINTKIGPTAKILIKKGTLKLNDIFWSNETWGQVKFIYNNNIKINQATPSMVVEIAGLSNIPKINKKFFVIKNKKIAKKISKIKFNLNKEIKFNKQKKNNNCTFNINNNKKINLIIKTDVLSSLKTIKEIIKKNKFNNFKIIYKGIGNINQTDLIFAVTTKSIIIAFNIIKDNSISKNKQYNCKIYFFNIIYNLINKLKKISNLHNNKILPKNINIIGKAIIKNIFKNNNSELIAGCIVIKGYIKINKKINIIRNNQIIYKGNIKSIKIFKNNVNIVKKNMECGIYIKNFNNIKIGDEIISKKYEKFKKTN